jgi:hypothetical protein
MILRIIIACVGILLAAVMFRFGGEYLGPLSPVEWVPSSQFPWIYIPAFDEVTWPWLVGAGVVGLLTLSAILDHLERIFSVQAQYVSRSRIIYLAILLAAGATLYGAFVQSPSGSLWTQGLNLLQSYPKNLLAWFLLAPLALVALNFVREIHRAMREYELNASSNSTSDLLEELGVAMLDRSDMVLARIHEMENRLMNIQKGVHHLNTYDNSPDLGWIGDEMQKLRSQMDGLFRQMRALSATKTPAAERPPTARPAVSVVAPSTEQPDTRPNDDVRVLARHPQASSG